MTFADYCLFALGNKVLEDGRGVTLSFSSEFIDGLPIAGRFYQNVLALAPGVQDPDGDGNPNVNGARERDFKTSVSGISNVDPLTGKFLNQISADSIGIFRAEGGRPAGQIPVGRSPSAITAGSGSIWVARCSW